MKKILFVFGTRPEAIKMAPIIKALTKNKNKYQIRICVTGQHKEMLDQVLDFFEIKYDYNLAVMKINQSLTEITSSILTGLDTIIKKDKIDLVLVQGDTTTAFAGALAAYYNKIKIGHIEAGLRSNDKYSPFPEEANRSMISRITDIHFAPTIQSKLNLQREGIKGNVYITGNTVIDALKYTINKIKKENFIPEELKELNNYKKIILVTGHRRESFGRPFENFCNGLIKIAKRFPEYKIIYPVHFNPNVQLTVKKYLNKISNIFLIQPLDYPSMIWLMNQSYFVITDSGGVQEEAPTLGKPILVTREVTERMEGIKSGTSILVGTKKNTIYMFAEKLITNKDFYKKMSSKKNPYGNGNSAKNISNIITKQI